MQSIFEYWDAGPEYRAVFSHVAAGGRSTSVVLEYSVFVDVQARGGPVRTSMLSYQFMHAPRVKALVNAFNAVNKR